ncbi:nucleoside deaminase [Arthrobacter sp. Soil764]|uniref:nucleoside deaminase n=1 Tax=Arthrobacter sp. Soil764 TaxID=1736403 RepID=UPI000AD9E224|nr:nucleoside deaminase [Arthrobacter sp. Soil764]
MTSADHGNRGLQHPESAQHPGFTQHPGQAQYLEQAVELATRNVAEGGGPFGAVVVTPDGRVHTGVNRVTRDNDPTAHAEVVAIRAAAAAASDFDLTGSVLYASCEPCPMCLASALWARIGRVYYAADRHGAAAAGFDDALFYDYFSGAAPELMPVTKGDIPTSDVPFQAWRAFDSRKEY